MCNGYYMNKQIRTLKAYTGTSIKVLYKKDKNGRNIKEYLYNKILLLKVRTISIKVYIKLSLREMHLKISCECQDDVIQNQIKNEIRKNDVNQKILKKKNFTMIYYPQ